jgi:hypothetical protein
MFPIPRDYLYLDAVARAGSIRKAAELLHVASTALNRKILELEDDLDARRHMAADNDRWLTVGEPAMH